MVFSYYIALVVAILYTGAVDTRTHSEIPLAKADQYLHYENYTVNKLNLKEEGQKRKALHSSTPFKEHLHVGELSSTCVLNVMNDSKTYFSRKILKHGYNFVYLKLNFINCTVKDTSRVINKLDWVWTYDGKNGAHQYLYLPWDFGYLSFGILWSHTRKKTIQVDINVTGDCSNLQIGTQETDMRIGNALGNMTAQIASQNDAYNSSYWCYNRRLWLSSTILYHLCRNAVCTLQTIEFSCYKFSVDNNNIRVVKCDNDHYYFAALWWMFPIILGEVGFAFYPILLTWIGIRVNRTILIANNDTTSSSNSLTVVARQTSGECYNTDESVVERSLFISLKQQNPITFSSTIFSPLYRCDFSGQIVSRVLRIWVIFLPMTLSIIRVCLDYKYSKDIVTEAVKKGVPVGFSSFIAGSDLARTHFLHVLGGPVVALAIYVIFGCMVIVFPSNFQLFLEKGLPESNGRYRFLAGMPLKLKERFSGVQIRPVTGYKRIHNIFIAHSFMLLHWKFWKHALKLFYIRWRYVLFQSVAAKFTRRFAVLCSVIALPVYIFFCLIELICTTLYFVFPVCNCFIIVIKAIAVAYFAVFRNCGLCLKMLRNLFILPLFVLVFITWYMYCIIFFDGCWFLSKIAMFTYGGIIAYPRLSYGYMILVFMALYYLMESLIAFGESYRDLLKLSIEACTKIQSKQAENSELESMEYSNIMNKHGINRELFYIVVDKHLPRRNQIMTTILKFSSVLTVLIISVELLITFDKIQELSLIIHVFTVLFICALPKLITVLCITRMHRHMTRKRLRQKIQRTIGAYMRRHMVERSSDSDEDEFLTISGSGYLNLSASDND